MTSEAIVMSVQRHTDGVSLVRMFTRASGMVTFAVRRSVAAGREGRVSRVASALLQPLSQLSVEMSGTAASDRVQPLRSASLSYVYESLPFRADKACVAMFLSEVLWYALRHEQASESLYKFLALSLQWFDGADRDYANFHLIFLLQLARYLGYDPSLLPEGKPYDVATLMRHNYRTMRLIRLNGEQRSLFLQRLLDFYREMVPGFPEIKSLAVVRDLF